jgi:predicted nucleic acid-binding protein
MPETAIVLDSNSVINHLNERLDLDAVLKPYPNCEKKISVITFIEVLAWPEMTPEKEREARTFLSGCTIVELTPGICEEAVKIRRTKKLRLPDSVIAATAVVLKVPVLSNDSGLYKLLWPNFRMISVI